MKKFIPFLLAAIFALAFYGCSEDSTTPANPERNLIGLWEAHVLDGDRDGVIDSVNGEMPHVFYMNFTKYDASGIEGDFLRIAFGKHYTFNEPFTGQKNGDHLDITVKDSLDNEIIHLDIDLVTKIETVEEDHFLAKWRTANQDSGEVLFRKRDIESEIGKAEKTKPPTEQNVNGKLVYKGGEGSQHVVFIHGFDSDPSTWNKLIGELLKDNNYKRTHKLYTYEYDWRHHIWDCGNRLKTVLSENHISDPVLIAHSMGGLVSRAYIASGGGFKHLITIASPHFGTPLGNASGIGRNVLNPIINFLNRLHINTSFITNICNSGGADLGWLSSFIRELHDNSRDKESRGKYTLLYGDIRRHYHCYWYFHGCRAGAWVFNHDYGLMNEALFWPLWYFAYDNDGVVPVISARGSYGDAWRDNHKEVPAWPYYDTKIVYLGDWDHVDLVDPTKVPKLLEEVKKY